MESNNEGQIVRVGVQAIVRRRNEILMVLRNRSLDPGTWCLPGGKLEPHETIIGCALRELREETGLKGSDGKIVAITDPLAASGGHMQIGVDIIDWSGDPFVVDPAECRDVKFFPENQLPHELFVSTVGLIDKLRRGVLY
jgi:8-oxo-dGTP diphosphatase